MTGWLMFFGFVAALAICFLIAFREGDDE